MSNNSFIDEMLISLNSWCVAEVREGTFEEEMENVLFLINVRDYDTYCVSSSHLITEKETNISTED